ncbi:MAG: site-specific integrase [Dysgonamonadaceae bacterium]|jgi:integrase|nr:site-specific integrase [Dysgonamonadaceae bacterium]
MKKLNHYVETLSEILKSEGKFRTARAYRLAQIRRYERWLVRRQLAMNTVSFYMRNLRAIYNRAVRANIVGKKRENPFSGVYTGIAKTVKRALAEADVKRLSAVASNISSFQPALPALKQTEAEALLIFHFCLLAQGMSFADAAFLKKKMLRDKNIVYRRRKTGKDIIVFVNPDMQKIIDFFAARVPDSCYIFPIIGKSGEEDEYRQYCSALSRQNRLLKTAGRKAGIAREFSSHAARHSWASIARNLEIPLTIISAALGHSSERTTQIYLSQLETGQVSKANMKIARFLKQK